MVILDNIFFELSQYFLTCDLNSRTFLMALDEAFMQLGLPIIEISTSSENPLALMYARAGFSF